jgi:PKD repeat protein
MKQLILLPVFIIAFISCDTKDDTKDDAIQKSTACFDYSPKTDLTVGLEISFSNCSQNAISFWWDFGDGNTSSLKDPKHTYQNAGSYTVSLWAQNDEIKDVNADGIIDFMDGTLTKDSISKTITVN